MTFKEWNEVAELIGIVAIVGSLIFVGLQIRQDHSIAITETRSAITASSQTIATLIQDQPEIWRRGLDGEELSADEELVFLATVRAVRNHLFNVYLRWERFGHIDSEEIARRFAFAVYVHPGLRNAFTKDMESHNARAEAFSLPIWGDEFGALVQANLQQLDATNPTIPTSKEYVFW